MDDDVKPISPELEELELEKEPELELKLTSLLDLTFSISIFL